MDPSRYQGVFHRLRPAVVRLFVVLRGNVAPKAVENAQGVVAGAVAAVVFAGVYLGAFPQHDAVPCPEVVCKYGVVRLSL